MTTLHKLKYLLIGGIATLTIATTALVANSPQLTLTKLSEFTQVFSHIKNYYVDDTDDTTLIENAIDGMLNKLDPHSAFLRPKDYTNLQVNTKGNFGGLGIVVNMNKDGLVEVVSPIDETPASKAGVQSGDLIVKINTENVKGMSLQDAVDRMRGLIGTTVTITTYRQGEKDYIIHTLTRATIEIQSVNSRVLEPHYGYIRINRFQGPTTEQFNANLDKLLKSQPDLKGLVFDLRNNPGGLLNSAIEISSTFMDGGTVVSTKGRDPKNNKAFSAQKGQRLKGVTIVILINEGSASASEIVAGALQDTKRAIIMGRTSFGKGSVQSVIPLKNTQAGLKLTVAKYYTPSGRTIQAEGITPDVSIPRVKVETLTPLARIKEKDLVGHLDNEQTSGTTTTTTGTETFKKVSIDKDYELYQALNLLKGISLSK